MNIITNNQKAKSLKILLSYKNEMTLEDVKYFENMIKQNYISLADKLEFQSNKYYNRAYNSGII